MSDWVFVRRVLTVFALAGLAALLWVLSDLLLMLFASVLMALALRQLYVPIARWTGWPESVALALVIVGVLALLVAVVLPFGPLLAEQIRYLAAELPPAATRLIDQFNLQPLAESLGNSAIGALAMRAFLFGTVAFAVLAGLVIVLFGGIYFARSPDHYAAGFVALFPQSWRAPIDATMADSGKALTQWLRAQGIAMVIVGTLTGLGMWLIGVPSPLALGLIAGLLEFIPIVGPVVGAVPALLLASSQGWDVVLWALAVAVVVQQIESNIVMPLVVGRVVRLPAAVGLFAVVAIGIVFGPLGLLLGYPLAIVIDRAVRRLYVRETLGGTVEIPGEATRSEAPRSGRKPPLISR